MLRSLANKTLPRGTISIQGIQSKSSYLNSIFCTKGIDQRFFAEKVSAIDLKKGDIIARKGIQSQNHA